MMKRSSGQEVILRSATVVGRGHIHRRSVSLVLWFLSHFLCFQGIASPVFDQEIEKYRTEVLAVILQNCSMDVQGYLAASS